MMLAPNNDAQIVGTYHNTQSTMFLTPTDEKLGAMGSVHAQTVKMHTRLQGDQCCITEYCCDLQMKQKSF